MAPMGKDGDGVLLKEDQKSLRGHSRSGRPLGDGAFVERVEGLVGREFRPREVGRKPKSPRQPESITYLDYRRFTTRTSKPSGIKDSRPGEVKTGVVVFADFCSIVDLLVVARLPHGFVDLICMEVGYASGSFFAVSQSASEVGGVLPTKSG